MRHENSISVIVPVYNVEQYVAECINSILPQLGGDDELIIINDGSSDGSLQICNQYVKTHDNVVIYSQANKGLGAARNQGVRMASGDYIIFVDSDDYLVSDAFDIIRENLCNLDLDVLQYDAETFNQMNEMLYTRNPYDRRFFLENRILSGKSMFDASYPHYYQPSACLMAIRRKFLLQNNISFIKGILHEDIPFTFHVMMNAERVKHISEQIYVRRYRPKSITMGEWSKERWYGIAVGMEGHLTYLQLYYDELPINLRRKILMVVWGFLNQMIDFVQNYEAPHLFLILVGLIDRFFKCLLLLLHKDESVSILVITLQSLNKLANETFLKSALNVSIDSIDKSSIEEKVKQYKKRKLQKVPFRNDHYCLGIFGRGRHTAGVLNAYQELIGQIRCEYVFFDSFIREDTRYEEKLVYNIRKAKGKVDSILISSYIYADEMNSMIDMYLGKDFARINLYDASDEIDLFS